MEMLDPLAMLVALLDHRTVRFLMPLKVRPLLPMVILPELPKKTTPPAPSVM